MKKRSLSPLCVALVLGLTQLLPALPADAATKKKNGSQTGTKRATAVRDPSNDDDDDAHPAPLRAVDPNTPPQVHAASVLVFDPRSNRILYEKNADFRRPIASTQKLLTALIIAESGRLDENVEVIADDTLCEPTKLDCRPGETYSRRDLLTALLVHSCNDVARLLARDNAGSIEDFAARMNSRAYSLGARNSHFVNPNGLPSPEFQFSTARDLACIARAAYGNSLLRSIMSTKVLAFQYNNGRVREFTNTNKVLARFPLCNGMKTGYTNAAGHCLVSSATNGERSVIAVCLGDNKAIWSDSQSLLAWGLVTPESPVAADLGRQP